MDSGSSPVGNEVDKAFVYLIMELGVFLLEDGAAILLLAKTANSSSLDVVQTISLCLTLICAGAFALVFLGVVVRQICQGGFDSGCDACMFASYIIATIAFPVFMIAILIKEVFLKGEDDPPFEGGIELASYIVYGIGAFIIGLFSIRTFRG